MRRFLVLMYSFLIWPANSGAKCIEYTTLPIVLIHMPLIL